MPSRPPLKKTALIDSRAGLWYDISKGKVTQTIMQDDEIILSPAKYKELEHELEHLTTTGRREIAERIKDARAMGDLSENFDYHDAKRQQGFLEGRIDNIKQMLERAKIAEYAAGGDIAAYGSTVKIHDIAYEEDLEYKIVGVMEADTSQNRISNTSPLGKALLGHKVGEVVEVQTPSGMDKYEILAIA